MKIELGSPSFQPIIITLESQQDAIQFANLLILAQENPSIQSSESELAESLLDIVAPDEAPAEVSDRAFVDIADDAEAL